MIANNKKNNRKMSEVEKFILKEALPAFQEIKVELEKEEKETIIKINKKYAIFKIKYNGREEFGFKIIPRITSKGEYPLGVALYPRNDGTEDEEIFDLRDVSKDEIVQKILNRYEYYIKLLSFFLKR